MERNRVAVTLYDPEPRAGREGVFVDDEAHGRTHLVEHPFGIDGCAGPNELHEALGRVALTGGEVGPDVVTVHRRRAERTPMTL